MKKQVIIIVLFIFVSLLSSCSKSAHHKKPINTNLEFWITEDVSDFDFSNYTENYGLFGGREYYGTGYVPTFIDDDMQDPLECVLYTITSYPDYSSKKVHYKNCDN